MFKSKFVFAVSFVALFAVGSAWAADPDAGIAGVSYVDRLLSDKQDKLVAETTGETGVIKTVAVENEKLSVTKSAVVADDIANRAVTTGKIADLNVTTPKIADEAVTTAKIDDSAVTVAKTTGIYGYIPTKSDGTGSAQIWVE